MPSANAQAESRVEPDPVESTAREIRACLEDERRRIYGEIQNYPTPIAGCDQQFNHLLERREDIVRELNGMREAPWSTLDREEAVRSLDAFIRSSRHLDDGTKRRMISALKEGLSKHQSRLGEHRCQA